MCMYDGDGVDKASKTSATQFLSKRQIRCVRRRRSLSGYGDEDSKIYVEFKNRGGAFLDSGDNDATLQIASCLL